MSQFITNIRCESVYSNPDHKIVVSGSSCHCEGLIHAHGDSFPIDKEGGFIKNFQIVDYRCMASLCYKDSCVFYAIRRKYQRNAFLAMYIVIKYSPSSP